MSDDNNTIVPTISQSPVSSTIQEYSWAQDQQLIGTFGSRGYHALDSINQNHIYLTDNVNDGNDTKLCNNKCFSLFCKCFFSLILVLLACLILIILIPPVGLLFSAISPAATILFFCHYYYKQQVTIGQITLTFFETMLWMFPLLLWDLIWILGWLMSFRSLSLLYLFLYFSLSL